MPTKNAKSKAITRTQRALEKMPPEIRKKCEKLRALLAESGPKDAQLHYQLGELVKDVSADEKKYGKGTVQHLARALGYDKRTLYRYGDVAKCWSKQELNQILRSKTATGIPISFSHLVEIAQEEERRRPKLLQVCLDESLSVRELKQRIRSKSKRASSGPSPNTTGAGALRSLHATSEAWLDGMERLEADITPLLDGPLDDAQIPALKKELEIQQQFAERLARLLARLQPLVESAERETSAPASQTNGQGAHRQLEHQRAAS